MRGSCRGQPFSTSGKRVRVGARGCRAHLIPQPAHVLHLGFFFDGYLAGVGSKSRGSKRDVESRKDA